MEQILEYTNLNQYVATIIDSYIPYTIYSNVREMPFYAFYSYFSRSFQTYAYKIDKKNEKNLICKNFQYYKEDYNDVVKFLSDINHPNIIKLLGLSYDNHELILESSTNVIILFELLHKINYVYKRKCGRFEIPILFLSDKIKIIKDICNGLVYLHNKGIYHHDLRSLSIHLFHKRNLSNFSSEFTAKIADIENYDLPSRQNDTVVTYSEYKCLHTLYYPPEIFTSMTRDKAKENVYQFGLLICEILTEKLPYNSDFFKPIGDFTLFMKSKKYDLTEVFPLFGGDRLIGLCEKCISNDPKERPTINEVMTELDYIEKEIKNNV
jgi:serine/threonine protein kinase